MRLLEIFMINILLLPLALHGQAVADDLYEFLAGTPEGQFEIIHMNNINRIKKPDSFVLLFDTWNQGKVEGDGVTSVEVENMNTDGQKIYFVKDGKVQSMNGNEKVKVTISEREFRFVNVKTNDVDKRAKGLLIMQVNAESDDYIYGTLFKITSRTVSDHPMGLNKTVVSEIEEYDCLYVKNRKIVLGFPDKTKKILKSWKVNYLKDLQRKLKSLKIKKLTKKDKESLLAD